MLQTLLNRIVFGMDPQAAVEAPRFATYSFPDSFEPHSILPGRLVLEARLPQALAEQLASVGHDVLGGVADWTWKAGAICMIDSDPSAACITPEPERPIGLLSGGNQQKVLLARWLATDLRPLAIFPAHEYEGLRAFANDHPEAWKRRVPDGRELVGGLQLLYSKVGPNAGVVQWQNISFPS
jgi:hypothetical protein